jgi:hypothetical protein
MTPWLGIHEELHRLVLLNRWIAWCNREWRKIGCKISLKHHRRIGRLRCRLQKAKPTWDQRHKGRFDAGAP